MYVYTVLSPKKYSHMHVHVHAHLVLTYDVGLQGRTWSGGKGYT